MKVLVTASERFAITNDNTLWTANAPLNYQFWTRYLDVYDEVYLLARTKLYSEPPPGWIKASGSGIKAVPVPYFIGPREFIQNYPQIKNAISKALVNAEAIQLRVPCIIAQEVHRLLARQRPYGVEVVTDPYDVFTPGSVKHPLRPFFRWWFPRQLQRLCTKACAAAYVTERALQQRYPPDPLAFSTHYSSIELHDCALVSIPRSFGEGIQALKLITVGTMDQLYKAPDVLIDAIAICVEGGLDLKLVLVGDGKYRLELESRAKKLGLTERVHFQGQLTSGDAVRAQLDMADLFVLPSYQEGLPKAMIEAMARALPCIGSTVGGIPELLPGEDLIPPGNAAALAAKIREVVTDRQRMNRMSARNLEKAREYKDEVLRERRIAFYRYVREKTELWLKTQK
ncbi:glycosyltransferase family 4 protein [Aerosakkonemataceae cyanobacterium BLCC-F154]|uniref:Glycosyltransferase family 4 protein n=1 Tax=Floridaenema fluviatile BLCC-F154 TaxID=3153640 RepID=A0ABV4Y5N4_9CYAN